MNLPNKPIVVRYPASDTRSGCSASSNPARRVALIATVLALLVPSGAFAQVITLAWDPNPESTVGGYIVYAGTQSGVYTEAFDAGSRTSFDYPNALSGQRYYFAVAAYSTHRIVGARSAEVSSSVLTSASSAGLRPAALSDDSVCIGSAGDSCYNVRLVGNELGAISSLRSTGDGRVFFIEDGRRVRVIDENGLKPVPAFAIDDPRRVLTDLAVDPAFDRTHLVFAAEVETRGDGSSELDIVRYRELLNVFGEAATVVAGIELPSQFEAAIATDSAGHLYAAIPAATATSHGTPYGGKVLRFNTDGTIPDGNPLSSPILADGFARPTAIQWDSVSGRLWLAGTDDVWPASLAVLQLPGSSTESAAAWPRRAMGMRLLPDTHTAPLRLVELAVGSGTVLMIGDAGQFLRLQSTPETGVLSVGTSTAVPYGEPVAIATDLLGNIYLGVRTSSGAFVVLELTPAR